MELLRIAADNNDIDRAAYTKVHGVYLVGGSDAAIIAVYNALTVTGDAVITLKAPTVESRSFWFGEAGIPFNVGISVDITGTDAVAYLLLS
jgi:hypothetical protein